MSKYVFITGGVVSGLGKGITAASLGKLMKARGYSVQVVKFNPFFNIDNSNLCPAHYGETFVTGDGRCCDLVIGHYERIMDESLTQSNDITSGEIYSLAIEKERQDFYDGQTVQVVPHITDEIKKCILRVGEKSDIVIVEVGGTVGDIEAQPYMEAVRQLKSNLGKTNVAYVHVSLVPYIGVSGEQKTKPTQHSVKELQNLGIQPDVIVCRSDYPLGMSSRSKLTLFCNVDKDCVIESIVTPNIYEIPLRMESEGFCSVVLRKLRLDDRTPDLSALVNFCESVKQLEDSGDALKIGLVDKNAEKSDASMSLRHALLSSSVALGKRVEVINIPTEGFTPACLNNLDGLIAAADVSDSRSAAAKMLAIQYARELDLPVLMLGDAAFLGLKIGSDKNIFKAEKPKRGLFEIKFKQGTRLYQIYGKSDKQRFLSQITLSKNIFEGSEFTAAGECESGTICAFEDPTRRFYLGVLFRPEFLSRPDKPSPLITEFLKSTFKS